MKRMHVKRTGGIRKKCWNLRQYIGATHEIIQMHMQSLPTYVCTLHSKAVILEMPLSSVSTTKPIYLLQLNKTKRAKKKSPIFLGPPHIIRFNFHGHIFCLCFDSFLLSLLFFPPPSTHTHIFFPMVEVEKSMFTFKSGPFRFLWCRGHINKHTYEISSICSVHSVSLACQSQSEPILS